MEVFIDDMAVMCELTVFDTLLAAVRSVAISNMFWCILVLTVVCRLLIVVMVEFIVCFSCWVCMSVKSAMAVMCEFVVVPNVDKVVSMVGSVFCPR